MQFAACSLQQWLPLSKSQCSLEPARLQAELSGCPPRLLAAAVQLDSGGQLCVLYGPVEAASRLYPASSMVAQRRTPGRPALRRPAPGTAQRVSYTLRYAPSMEAS
jgi:hypothetical protein